MKKTPFVLPCGVLVGCLTLAVPAPAELPTTLLRSIPTPPVGLQTDGAQLGYSVAVDGGYAVAGVPLDDIGEEDSGVVKVFDSTTGTLLFVLPNPSPTAEDSFGISVAISGTRVVVGAYQDDTAAPAAGSAYVFDLSSATPTVPVATLNNPGPAAEDQFGKAVAISGTRVVVGAHQNDTGAATDAGSAYVYDLTSATPTVPVATLNNPGPAVGDRFGVSVAISGTRVVVGANGNDIGASTDAGSAYVYDLSSATPTVPATTLNNPGPAVGDQFGISVAISGTRVVVGAHQDNTGATDSGVAYAYNVSSATPTVPVATLNNPGPATNDLFGYTVAISGTRVVVGAHQNDTGATDAGGAYVYDLSSGTPTVPVTTLNNRTPATNDFFGYSVAISATQVMVGAYGDDLGATDAGTAYVHVLASATPTVPVATLNHPGPARDDQFGTSVAVSGRLILVGAPYEDTGAIDAGSAYVYDLSDGWATLPTTTLHNPSPTLNDFFGYSVAMAGSIVAVGAYQDDTGASNAGSAYVYDVSSATPTVPVTTLNNPSPTASDQFGVSVAISGTRVVVGARGDDTGATDAGSAYVFDLSSATPTVPVATLNNPSPTAGDHFGYSVAISGTRVVVGTWLDDTGAIDAGMAYVFDLSSATPKVPVATLKNPSPTLNDYFGRAVGISGTNVIVGAYLDDAGATDAGSAYLFNLTSPTPTVPVATLNNPGPAADDRFGWSVAISGTRMVVGACFDDSGANSAGSAYAYDTGSGALAVPVATFNNPGPAPGDQFATSVAIDGTTVAIGTPYDDTVMSDKGFAYIYGSASAPTDSDNDGLPDSWELTFWPTIAGHGPTDDFDSDGYTELLELALGQNPTLPNTGNQLPITTDGDYLTMTISKQPGVLYEVQSGSTLEPDQPDSFSATTTTVLLDNATTLKVRDNSRIGTLPARFMRAKVTAAP